MLCRSSEIEWLRWKVLEGSTRRVLRSARLAALTLPLLLGADAAFAVTTFQFQKTGESGDPAFHPLVATISIEDSAVASGTAELSDVVDLSFTAATLDIGIERLQPFFGPYRIDFSADRTSITIFRSTFLRLGPFSWQFSGNPGGNISASRIAVTGDRVGLGLEILAEANGSWVLVNDSPDCSGAAATLGELWPPNHEFHQLSVEGVTDPDGDPISVTIIDLFQDEAVNAPGSGNTCPDGDGIGTDTALLRGERSGASDGRVYHIEFVAEDGQGGECSGSVTICHPHDQGQGSVCVDQGPLFDSTGPCHPGNDADADGLLDTEEFAIGTHVLNPDTDGDGASDAAELAAGTDPLAGVPLGGVVPVPSLPAWGWATLAIAVIVAGASVRRRRTALR